MEKPHTPATQRPGNPGTVLPLHLEAAPAFRRATMVLALLLVALEVGVFWFAARLTLLLRPPEEGDLTLLAGFIAFWSVLTLQAMVVVGFAWTLVALAGTTLEASADGLSLAHPWRRWSGPWSDVAEAYLARDWLHLRIRGRMRAWHVRLPQARRDTVAQLQGRLPADAWLTPDQVRRVLLKRLLPPLLIGMAIAAGAIVLLDQLIARVAGTP